MAEHLFTQEIKYVRSYSLEELKQIRQRARGEDEKPFYEYDNEVPPEYGYEYWQTDPERKRNKYAVSNFGRVKLDGKILKQINCPIRGEGWLVLEEYPTVLVYQLVAEAWLQRPCGSGWQIHHINNDGYDNRPENLIYVEEELHHEIHKTTDGVQ